jgi:DNA polymerase-3 subunit gamma/tau
VARLPEAEPVEPALAIGRFEDLIALAAQKRDLGVKLALERDVRLVRCDDGRLEIALEQSAAKTLVNDLARKFSQWTNRRWMVVVSAEAGQPTVRSQDDARQAELKTGVRAARRTRSRQRSCRRAIRTRPRRNFRLTTTAPPSALVGRPTTMFRGERWPIFWV